MIKFTFFLEGLNREATFTEETEGLARAGIWNDLTNDEQDAVVQIECIETEEFEMAEILSPLYPVPDGFECETIYGLFESRCLWKPLARQELERFLAECRGEFVSAQINTHYQEVKA